MKRNFLIIKILLLLACFTGSFSYASDVSLNASVYPEKGTAGIPLTYTLTISGIDPASLKITLPEKKIVYPEKKADKAAEKKNTEDKSPDEFVPLYIINSATRDESEANGIRQINVKLVISYYRPGTYTLPELKITGTDGVGIGYKIPTVIIEEINKEGNFEEIEPPVSLSGNYTRVIWIIAAILVLAAAVFLLYRYLKKRRRPAAPEAPPVPPIEIFLSEVEALKLRELIETGRINQYVFDISIIFRRFISSMLMFDAAEMTTDEIASKIKKYMPHQLYTICGDEIISNMRLWDFSKFAEFTPSRELLIGNLDATISAAKRISEMERSENGTPGL